MVQGYQHTRHICCAMYRHVFARKSNRFVSNALHAQGCISAGNEALEESSVYPQQTSAIIEKS